ncbi:MULTISPECIES: YhgE/Pip domain-containing protein [unclassified Microbacterium]|uniref:YhgE/Pip domain-containing protein n=1 Tax=unclassified Microbacterium TaxID=2609290 RepID=UPI00300FAF0A
MTTRLSSLIERARSRRPVTWLTLLGVLLLPGLLGGALVAALQNPTERLEEMTAAIVNLDEPVEIDGQLAPLGRQLASGLVEGSDDADSNLTWVISNEDDAASGLANGTYQAVVTIPEDFSSAATSGGRAINDTDVTAEKARISVSTAPEARVADGLIADQIAQTAATTMGTALSETTLENVLLGFTTLGDQIGEAANGADTLAGGARDAATGAAKLPDGATQLASGAGELATGADGLATGAAQLGDGAGQLAGGAGQLAGGADQLAGGLDTIAAGTRDAQSGAAQLGAGLTGGADQLEAQGIVPQELLAAADGAAQATSGVAQGVTQLAQGLDGLNAACALQATPEFCAQLAAVSQGAAQLQDPAAQAAQAAGGTSQGLAQLAQQAPAQIAGQMRTAGSAASELAAGLGQLADGTDQSASGARNLSLGATGLQNGATGIADGAHRLADGATQLGDGARQLGDGATQLADGATALSGGIGQLAGGTSDLAAGLHQAATALPSYSDSEASSLASVVSSPVDAEAEDALFGPTAIPLLAAVVLWFGGLASFVVMRAVTARALTSRRSSASLAVRALAPAAALGAGQGLLVALIVQTVARYDAGHWWAFAGIAMLVGVAFAAVNQALVAVLGGAGRWLAAIAGVAAIAAGIISTLPGWLAGAAGFLPTTPAATALLVGDGAGAAITGVVVWGVLSFVATILAVVRRRTTSAEALAAAPAAA